jgi:maleamate amidohydrolase
MADMYQQMGYGARQVGFGQRPGIVVVDFQTARRHRIPVASCYTAYTGERDTPYWKIPAVVEQFRHGHPCTALDPRIYDPQYDVVVRKTGPSIFFQTPVVPYFIKAGVDTVIITGCNTSGCIRASTIDSFQYGYRTIIAAEPITTTCGMSNGAMPISVPSARSLAISSK